VNLSEIMPEGARPWTRAARQRLYRGLAMLLYRLPRGTETVLRIVQQRSGSHEDYALALQALSQAGVELVGEKKSLKRSLRGPGRRRRK
jgi:hypothetical protein